jgi:hypothetical protein
MESVPTDPKKPKPSNAYLKYSSLGLQLFGAIGLSAWAGYKLDQYLRFQFPVFLLTFVLGAFAGMMVMVYRSINND